MKRTIEYFEKPNCRIQLRNIVIKKEDYTFSLELGTKTSRQKKFRYQTITGKVHNELMEWFTKLVDEKIPVKQDDDSIAYIPTGNKLTLFNIYLNKRGIEYKPKMLSTMVFECENTSDSYEDCPLKVVVHKNGATLTKVNTPAKKLVQYVNPDTGEIKTSYVVPTYIDKNGNRRRSFVSKDYYLRYLYITTKEVEVATQEDIQAAQEA